MTIILYDHFRLNVCLLQQVKDSCMEAQMPYYADLLELIIGYLELTFNEEWCLKTKNIQT